jgi:outer membrane receptor protein involved in Fe transport
MRLRVAIAVILLSLGTLAAQTFRGGIQGTVTDATGATVSGAQVTATNTGTALARTTTSDDQGGYIFSELPLGDYTVTITKSGFKTQTVKGVTVEVAASQHVDVKLTPGEVKETMEVTAAVPLVDTTSNVMGGTISGKTASNLPISGRDFIKLMVFVPGATADASGVSDSPGTFGQFSINGNRGRANNYLLDGTDMNDGYRNDSAINEAGVFGTPATLLPIDAVAEFPVLSNVQAEYGRNAGAIVNIVTKSGTNSFHGTLFEYFRNDALDARNYFNSDSFKQSKFRNNQFGGSIGGPIWKDHTFFFAAYEGQRERVGIPTISVIPTQDQVNCFLLNGGTIHPIISNLLALNPWTQGSALPVSGDGGAATLGDLCATTPATPLSTTLDAAGSNDLSSFIGKIDHHFSQGDVLTGRYFYGHSDQSFPLGLVGGSAVPGFNTVTPTTVNLVSVSYTHTFSPRTLLEIRFGYNRFWETFFPQDSAFDPATIGLNNTGSSQDFGLPLMKFLPEPFPSLGPNVTRATSSLGANSSVPRGRTDSNWQLFGNMAHTMGRHNLKWGYEFRRTFVSQFFDAGFRGQLSFCNFNDFLQGLNNCGGNNQRIGDSNRGTFQNNHGLYFQDDWRVTNRLTLNLGIRWDYYGVIGEENNRFSLFNGDTVTPAVLPTHQLYPKDFNNFGPRLAFSYDLFGDSKTVLRGGWGLYYDAFSQDFFVGQLPWPTFNSGPAYNFVPGSASAIQLSYAVNPLLGQGACVAGTIPIPGSASCAAPTFLFDPVNFGNDTFTVDQNIATPYVQNYNVNMQHEFSKNIALQFGYVGSTGKKLFRYRDINQAGSLIGFPAQFGFGYLLQFESTATSQYNSLQTNFRIQNFHGLNSTVNYTWGHSIDDASDGLDDVPNTAQPNNSFNTRAERGRSSFDTRHRFSWLFNYEFPKASHTQWLLNGWAMDGAFSYSSGQPFTVSYIANFCCDFDGMGEFFGRPDLVGDPFAGTHGPGQFLNLDAFAVPCTYGGGFSCAGGQHPGSSPRNAFNGPSYHNFDFSLSKTTPIGDRVKLQFRVDAFNIFNHPNFTNPLLPNFFVDFTANGLNETAGPHFGHGVGFLPLTATPDVGIGNPFLGGGGPRNIQLGLKLTF